MCEKGKMTGGWSKVEHPCRIGILMEEACTHENERAYAFKSHVLVVIQAQKVLQVSNDFKMYEYDI